MSDLPNPTNTHVPFRDKDGIIRMYEIPSWWCGGIQDIYDTVKLVKKGRVDVLCHTPGGRPVYMVMYGEKNNLKRTANLSSALGAGKISCYADKSCRDYIPTVCIVGACHGGEFEGVVAINNLIKNIETGTDYAGNANSELMEALQGVNLILLPCVNMDGRARIPLKTFVGQSFDSFRYYSQGTWKDGTLCNHPGCKEIHPIKDYCDFLGGYFNDDGVNIVHDNFFFPMAKETIALLKVADEYVPDITLHLHGGGNDPNCFFLFNYMPKVVKDKIADLSHRVAKAMDLAGVGERYYEMPVIGSEDKQKPPSFNIQSAWTALCGEPCIIYESNQGLLYEVGRGGWDQSDFFDDIYLCHKVLFKETFKYVKANGPEKL